MHVHLIGVCGTGMGSLAGLLKLQGHRVTGSDTAFYPPMGEALQRWGIETREGFDPAHLKPEPELVIVGNVCRPDNPEARAALDGGMRAISFPAALARFFLDGHDSYVVAGTHGKTTTSALLAYLLHASGRGPGFLIGGVPTDFETSFAVGEPGAPFVVEGDEYDSAFFEKTPKFWQYEPKVAVINAIEHDHIDIYPDFESYRRAFTTFVAKLPADGLLLAAATDPEVVRACEHARCPVRYFGLADEPVASDRLDWVAETTEPSADGQDFDLMIDKAPAIRLRSALHGRHNLRNALAALAMAHEGAGVALDQLASPLSQFGGIKRRQELRGEAAGVRVYDDFAHHPTAVQLTLEALRAKHPRGTLVALFEPRSATASRRLHQEQYPAAFKAADVTLLAPVGRANVPIEDRLDVVAIAAAIRDQGGEASACDSIDAMVEAVAQRVRAGDTVVAMSNGAFGAIHERLLRRLATG